LSTPSYRARAEQIATDLEATLSVDEVLDRLGGD
jgi:hypothetical protein